MHTSLSTEALNQIFTEARTHFVWLDKAVSTALLQEIYDLAKMGSTSANCQPMRVTFVASQEGKEMLKDCMFEGNLEKTMTAPVTAIFAYDMTFYEHLPVMFPPMDARPWFTGSEAITFEHAFRNASLQAAYFMLAARATGLDCGPMSGFDTDKVNATFFKDTPYKVNFMCNLGYGDISKVYDRLPRHSFDAACRVL